ncbi:MAG: hypothetical protein KGQ59_04440 [Bdellovibrionales bacterium]|nr:hypothetical protein [Bdellovibrionales bacterium]
MSRLVAVTSLILGFSLLSNALAQGEEPAPKAAAEALINEELAKKEQGVLECVRKRTSERVQSLKGLDDSEKRIEERFDSLQTWVAEHPSATDAEVQAKLAQIFSETESELKSHLSSASGDATLDAYRRGEASRVLAETALRICIAGANDPAVVDKYRKVASEKMNQGLSALEDLSVKRRQSDIPAVLARMARTELSLAQFDRLRDGQANSTVEQFDRIDSVIKKYEKISGKGAERDELNLIHLEALLISDQSGIGDAGGTLYLDPDRMAKFTQLKSAVKESTKESKGRRYLARARHLSLVSEFFSPDRSERESAVERLGQQLVDTDSTRRQEAQTASLDLMNHLSGTTLGKQVLDKALAKSKDQDFQKQLKEAKKGEQEQAKSYDENKEKALGREMVDKLGLPSYNELLRSNGMMKQVQQEYMGELSKLGALQAKRLENPESVTDGEIQEVLARADLQWAYLRCAREQAGIIPESRGNLKAPFSTLSVDLGPCRKLRGSSQYHQAGIAAAKITDEAIIRHRNSQIAWIGGEFAFDVATTLVSGGLSNLAKAPIKAGLKKAGTMMLRRELANPALIKTGVRASRVVANTLATDLSVQTAWASRSFLEAGFRGRWDASIFTDNIAYLNKDTNKAQHAVRLFTTAAAAKGLEVVWGKAPMLAPTMSQWISSSRVSSVLGESAKGVVNGQFIGVAGQVASIPFEGCSQFGQNLLDGDRWITSMKDSLLGKVKGGNRMGARYLGTSLIEKIADFEADALTSEQLAQLEECVLPSSPQNPEVKEEGK